MNEKLQKFIHQHYNLHSRVHSTNGDYGPANLYIKRDDELSSGITGSKYRKFASLIPFLTHNGYKAVILIGSSQSNNIVGALQLLNENKIKSTLVLLESNEKVLKGNMLWMSLLHDMTETIVVKRENWAGAYAMARQVQAHQREIGNKVFVLPEGALTAEAMPGAMSLADDIVKNETEKGIAFQHIFMDSGSWAAAIGLLLGLQLLGRKYELHITLIAGTEAEFMQHYEQIYHTFLNYSGIEIPAITMNLHFHKPVFAPSFGSVTTTVLNAVKAIAREEGILMDPVYSAKHFFTAKEVINAQNISGNCLFIYSGGSFGLSGFQEMLGK